MASPTSTVVPKASGFKTAVANIITSPLVLDKLQEQCYEESISGMITTAQFNNNFARGCLGREIIIQREGLGSSFKYCADGQALETNVPEEYTATSFKLRRSRYTRMMWSELDKLEHCGTNLGTMLASQMRANAKDVEYKAQKELLQYMVNAAGCFNKGKAAGVNTGSYDLGAMGAPLLLNADNIYKAISYANAALDEQGCSGGMKFMVLPIQAETLFINSQLNAHSQGFCCDNKSSSYITGAVPKMIFGDMHIYFSKHLCKRVDGALDTYAFPFGYKEATAFYYDAVATEEGVSEAHNPFIKSTQTMYVYDFAVIDERGLGAMYANFTV